MRHLPLKIFTSSQTLYLLWLFLLVFPKGGFKIGGVPLTWGYLLLGLFFLASLSRSRFSCHTLRIQALILTLPFQALSALSFLLFGTGNPSFAISFAVGFFFFPPLFFLFFSEALDKLNISLFFRLLKKGFFFIASYGIFLFFYKFFTLKFIEIPFLTTNFHDLGELDSKFINRGSIFKLISTYNNGNIYGISLLLFFPLYQSVEKSLWKKGIVILSLILSLSRTVWIGLLCSTLASAFLTEKKTSYAKLLLGLSILPLFIGLVMSIFGFDLSFLFDANLGGRASQLSILEHATLLPNTSFDGICEIVYLGILHNFGLIGLFAYLLCMAAPLILSLSIRPLSSEQKQIFCGLCTYLFVSASDGALLFIPVLAFYWFLSSLLFHPSFQRDRRKNPFSAIKSVS